MTVIKICGLTNIKDALNVARMDLDILGLVFAESTRQVAIEQAAEITAEVRQINNHVAIAGVFVNENPQIVNRTAEQCSLDMVQLSGDESWSYCREIGFPIIKVLHVSRSTSSDDVCSRIKLHEKVTLKRPFVCMLDTRDRGGMYGGTGQAFDWDVAKEVAAEFPVLIAGGLSASNVGGLIRRVNPLGVDVSSGVETDGVKDMNKIRDFIAAARSADSTPVANTDFIKNFISKGD